MLHIVSTILLGPLLLLQGRHVRRTVERLPEPPGARFGQDVAVEAGGRPPLRLLVIGDSAAAGVGADSQDAALSGQLVERLRSHARLDWRLHAASGATTAEACAALMELPVAPYDVVVSSLGVNDVTAGRSLRAWQADQQRLVSLLRERFGARLVLLSAVPPMDSFPALPQPLRWYLGRRAREFNRALQHIAAQHEGCEYARFDIRPFDPAAMARDGFHPGPPAYAVWAADLAARIRARFPA